MKFVTNKISTGKSRSFADLVSEYTNKQQGTVKTASVAAPVVKTAEAKQEEGKSSGQLDVEPLHQHGESTPKVKGKSGDEGSEKVKSEASAEQPVVVADTKVAKTKTAEGVQDKDNENNGPAEESGQTKGDFPKLTNDPKAGEHRDGDGDQKKAEAAAPVKEAGKGNIANLTAPRFGPGGKPVEDKKEDKKEASQDLKFVKIANLDSKSKAWLKKYWSDLYMPEYADAMTADK